MSSDGRFATGKRRADPGGHCAKDGAKAALAHPQLRVTYAYSQFAPTSAHRIVPDAAANCAVGGFGPISAERVREIFDRFSVPVSRP